MPKIILFKSSTAILVTLVNSYRTNSRDNRQQIFHPCLAVSFIWKNIKSKYPRWIIVSKFIYEAFIITSASSAVDSFFVKLEIDFSSTVYFQLINFKQTISNVGFWSIYFQLDVLVKIYKAWLDEIFNVHKKDAETCNLVPHRPITSIKH